VREFFRVDVGAAKRLPAGGGGEVDEPVEGRNKRVWHQFSRVKFLNDAGV